MPLLKLTVLLLAVWCVAIRAPEEPEIDPDVYFDSWDGNYESRVPGYWKSVLRDIWANRVANFGTGMFTLGFPVITVETVRAITQQPDGKLVMAGYAMDSDVDFLVARIHADGEFDTSFATQGYVYAPLGDTDELAHGVALQTNGRVVVVGRSEAEGRNPYFKIARYTTSGSLDTSFNRDGLQEIAINDNTDIARAVVIQTDGKILTAGYTWLFSQYNFAVSRLNSDGWLDTSFNTRGKLTYMMSASDSGAMALSLDADGRGVLTGPVYSGGRWDIGVLRVETNGSVDTSFNTTGKRSTQIGSANDKPYSVDATVSGKITVAGYAGNANTDIGVARYLSDGSIDTSFNTDGEYSYDVNGTGQEEAGFATKVQTDGSTLVAGHGNANKNLVIIRIDPTGTLDTSFSTDGKYVYVDGASLTELRAIHLNASGSLFTVGGIGGAGGFTLLRLASNGALGESGSLDVSFGTGGSRQISVGATDTLRAIKTQTDGRLVAFGDNVTDQIYLRFYADGTLDTSFATDGSAAINLSGNDCGYELQISTNGELVGAGGQAASNNHYAISRLLTSGTLDTAFHSDGKFFNTGVTTFLDTIGAFVIQTNGKIFFSYMQEDIRRGTGDYNVGRMTTGGSLDTSFSTSGVFGHNLGGAENPYVVALSTSGAVVVAGDGGYARYFSDVSRWEWATSDIDTSFDTDGIQATGVGSPKSVVENSYESLVGLGGTSDFSLVRIYSNGVLDTSFMTDGTGDFDIGAASTDLGRKLAKATNDKLYGAGTSADNFAIIRIVTSGALDTSFSTDGKQTTDLAGNDIGYSVTISPTGHVCVGGAANGNVDFGIACYWP